MPIHSVLVGTQMHAKSRNFIIESQMQAVIFGEGTAEIHMYMYMYMYMYKCTCCLGCVALLCFVVCMTLLASFASFCISH